MTPISFTSIGKEYVLTVREELYKENLLRIVAEVALTKLLTLPIGPSDKFVFEIFGLVVYKDPSEAPTALFTFKGLKRDMQLRKTRKDTWNPVESIEDLGNLV